MKVLEYGSTKQTFCHDLFTRMSFKTCATIMLNIKEFWRNASMGFCPYSGADVVSNVLQNILVCVFQKKVMQVRNGMRVSNFICGDYPFKKNCPRVMSENNLSLDVIASCVSVSFGFTCVCMMMFHNLAWDMCCVHGLVMLCLDAVSGHLE